MVCVLVWVGQAGPPPLASFLALFSVSILPFSSHPLSPTPKLINRLCPLLFIQMSLQTSSSHPVTNNLPPPLTLQHVVCKHFTRSLQQFINLLLLTFSNAEIEKEKLCASEDVEGGGAGAASAGGGSGGGGVSASLTPAIWEKTIPYDGETFHLEYMDLDEFLLENGIPVTLEEEELQKSFPSAAGKGKSILKVTATATVTTTTSTTVSPPAAAAAASVSASASASSPSVSATSEGNSEPEETVTVTTLQPAKLEEDEDEEQEQEQEEEEEQEEDSVAEEATAEVDVKEKPKGEKCRFTESWYMLSVVPAVV